MPIFFINIPFFTLSISLPTKKKKRDAKYFFRKIFIDQNKKLKQGTYLNFLKIKLNRKKKKSFFFKINNLVKK